MKDFICRSLPKWPAMVVRGEPVTEHEAKEIIRRTDRFFWDSFWNNEPYRLQVAERLRFTEYMKARIDFDKNWTQEDRDSADLWRKKWRSLPCSYYVNNEWVDCSFIAGAHGWCHPNGTIRFDDNIGKWPSVEEVLKDWSTIAESFEFLDLTATLMSGESCEDSIRPIVTIKVSEGQAVLMEPKEDFEYPAPIYYGTDNAIPSSWLDEWEELAKRIILI